VVLIKRNPGMLDVQTENADCELDWTLPAAATPEKTKEPSFFLNHAANALPLIVACSPALVTLAVVVGMYEVGKEPASS
jgi:hypothetical protein